MVGQAIRGRWPIRDQDRPRIIEALVMIATAPEMYGIREGVAAAKALLDADRLNQADEALERKQPRLVQDPETGRTRVDFSAFTNDELDAFLEGR